MSRLRATVSPTATDREIHQALDRATREIESALQIASSSPLPRHSKRRTLGDLRSALVSVSRVSYLGPPLPERESHEDWKSRTDQKRQARIEGIKTRKENSDARED